MVYGPCGGVRADGGCEMVAMPCVFPGAARRGRLGAGPGPVQVPLVLTDLSAPPADAATLIATARVLAPSCDAVLVGDHQDRPDFPPSMLARLVAEAGARPWVTLACRDRNRIALEQELRGLRHDGLATVLCVTGDGRAFDVRPDVTQAFDLDGTRLAALASRDRAAGGGGRDADRSARRGAARSAGPEAAGRRAGRRAQPRPVRGEVAGSWPRPGRPD